MLLLELLQLKLLPVSVYGVEHFLLLDQLGALALGNDSIAAVMEVMEVMESLVETIKQLVLSHGTTVSIKKLQLIKWISGDILSKRVYNGKAGE